VSLSFGVIELATVIKRRLTVEAVVLDPRRGVLLVMQGRTRHDWELPGGKVKKTEFLLDAVVRETLEETSIHVKPARLLGMYYVSDDDVYDFVFLCHPTRKSDQPFPNPPEIAQCEYFPLNALPSQMRPFTRKCIHDAINDRTQPLPMTLTAAQWLG
jgi:8-oxo-dGTP pyrophosphatase MutT (NUDIX family)